MKFLKKLFAKKSSDEKATIRLSSLSKWIDLQYKTILDPVLLRIQTNEESLKQRTVSLHEAIEAFDDAQYEEEKAHVRKLVDDYSSRFSRDVYEFIAFLEIQEYDAGLVKSYEVNSIVTEKVLKLLDSHKKYENVLFKYYKQLFKQVVEIIQKISNNTQQYSDIIDHESVRSYLKVKAQLSNFFEKKKKKSTLIVEKKKLIQQFDEQHILFDKYNTKANAIIQDPKYLIEQEQQRKPAYYELEFKDYDSKRVQIRKKCVTLKNQIDEIHSQILNLNLKNTLIEIQKHILEKVKIEVEILED